MTQTSVDPTHTLTTDVEATGPADDNGYRILSISFLIGMAFIFGFFILMLVLLAGAS